MNPQLKCLRKKVVWCSIEIVIMIEEEYGTRFVVSEASILH